MEAVLRDAAQLAHELDLTERERAVLALAACAHDVVYYAAPGTDEEASASWAHDHLLRAGLSGDAIERVTQLLLLTLDHNVTEDDVVGAALLDADLAILGLHETSTTATARPYERSSPPCPMTCGGLAALTF